MNYSETISRLLGIVLKEGASDLHLTAGRVPAIRVNGDLIPLMKEGILEAKDIESILFSLLNEENKKKFIEGKEIDFAHTIESGERFRCNGFYSRGVVGIAIRSIQKSIRTFEELNLPPILKEFAFKEQGFFLVVGPVGQGKSTTLAAMIDLINKERREHIVTIEDPIEYLFASDQSIIDQREVRFDTVDFRTALKAMFRQDVNAALIGEMRDPETIGTAVTAAETGHLILSTLHTNNAAQSIDRIIDSFPGTQQNQIRQQLAGSLLGIFSQRLVNRISGGLIPAYELLINNYAVANLIREARTSEINVVIETSSEFGMIDLNHSLADLVRRGEITTEEATRHSMNPVGLGRLL